MRIVVMDKNVNPVRLLVKVICQEKQRDALIHGQRTVSFAALAFLNWLAEEESPVIHTHLM